MSRAALMGKTQGLPPSKESAYHATQRRSTQQPLEPRTIRDRGNSE